MKRFFASLAAATVTAAALAAPAASDVLPPSASSAAGAACDLSNLKLEEAYETVLVGGASLAIDSVIGGPGHCVGSASSNSENVLVTLEVKHDVASVRIRAIHDGFATVNVFSTDGAPIGSILVSVYPRESRSHGGRG